MGRRNVGEFSLRLKVLSVLEVSLLITINQNQPSHTEYITNTRLFIMWFYALDFYFMYFFPLIVFIFALVDANDVQSPQKSKINDWY